MAIQLGENPWVLIGLMFFELFLIILPGLISSKIEKKPFKVVVLDMGFQKNDSLFIKIIAGIGIGILFFFFGSYLIIFFRDFIVINIFGDQFVIQGQNGAITKGCLYFSW